MLALHPLILLIIIIIIDDAGAQIIIITINMHRTLIEILDTKRRN